jgi:hypothetical protein
MVPPALGQEIIFEDDFEADYGFWLTGPEDPADPRTIDPLDPTNQVARVVWTPWAGFPDLRSVPILVDMASTYILSFRFLDESPEIQTGGVALRVDPLGPEEFVMPFQLIADGSWHDYSFEFIPGELFDPDSGSITIALTGACWDMDNGSLCEGETYNFFDDVMIVRTGAVPSEAVNWGGVKALFR